MPKTYLLILATLTAHLIGCGSNGSRPEALIGHWSISQDLNEFLGLHAYHLGEDGSIRLQTFTDEEHPRKLPSKPVGNWKVKNGLLLWHWSGESTPLSFQKGLDGKWIDDSNSQDRSAHLVRIEFQDGYPLPNDVLPPRINALANHQNVTYHMLRKLQQPISATFKDTPNENVFEFMRVATGVSFVVTANVLNQNPLTLELTDIPAEKALNLVCKKLDAKWEIKQLPEFGDKLQIVVSREKN